MTDFSDKEPVALSEAARDKLRAAFLYFTEHFDGASFGGAHVDVAKEDTVQLSARKVGVAYDREILTWLCTVDRPLEGLDEHSVTDVYVLPDDPDDPPRVERVVQRYDEDEMITLMEYEQLRFEWEGSLTRIVVTEGLGMIDRDIARMETWVRGYQDFIDRVERAAELMALAMTEEEYEKARETGELLEIEAEFDDSKGEEDVPRDDTPLGRHMQLVDDILDKMTDCLEIRRGAELTRSVLLLEVIRKGQGRPLDEPAAFGLMQLIAKVLPK